jgi:hypothetical protein
MKTRIFNIVLELIIFFGLLFCNLNLYAQQGQGRLPRVMDAERQLTKDALDFLKSRFPDYPVIVTVSIDPLFRGDRTQKQKGEVLPYFKLEEEEIQDEWDDPLMPTSALLLRVKKIVLNVSVPNTLTDDEIAEIQQSLTINLNLVAARDTVQVIKRSWNQKKDAEFEPTRYIWLGLLIWLMLVIALLIAIWTPIRQIVRTLKEGVSASKASETSGGGTSNGMLVMSKGGDSGLNQSDSGGRSSSGDLRFSDPIRLQSAVGSIISDLAKTKDFPNLKDMILLDDVCRTNHSAAGALLMEFPLEIRERIFSLTYGNHWLEAMIKPGILDIKSFELAHQLNRSIRNHNEFEWQQLVIMIWRLNERRGEFLRDLDQNDAFTILDSLPKSLALKTAREMYPGSWAILLDPKFEPKRVSSEKIQQTANAALKIFPLRDMAVVEKFRHEKDLIGFLRTAEPHTEKEIYTASSKDSILHQVRPPFYKVLELSKEQLADFVPQISIGEWALALVNVPNTERKNIEAFFGPKQKMRYLELLTRNESGNIDSELLGEVREKLALIAQKMVEEEMIRKLLEGDSSAVEAKNEAA